MVLVLSSLQRYAASTESLDHDLGGTIWVIRISIYSVLDLKLMGLSSYPFTWRPRVNILVIYEALAKGPTSSTPSVSVQPLFLWQSLQDQLEIPISKPTSQGQNLGACFILCHKSFWDFHIITSCQKISATALMVLHVCPFHGIHHHHHQKKRFAKYWAYLLHPHPNAERRRFTPEFGSGDKDHTCMSLPRCLRAGVESTILTYARSDSMPCFNHPATAGSLLKTSHLLSVYRTL